MLPSVPKYHQYTFIIPWWCGLVGTHAGQGFDQASQSAFKVVGKGHGQALTGETTNAQCISKNNNGSIKEYMCISEHDEA